MITRRRTSFRRSGFRRSPRRQLVWARGATNGSIAANTLSSVTLLGNFETDIGGDLVGWTVVRQIIDGFACMNLTQNAEGTLPFTMVNYIDEDVVDATQVTGSQGSDPKSYLWHYRNMLYSPNAITSSAQLAHGSACVRFHQDVKSRRRFRRPDEVFRTSIMNEATVTFALQFELHLSVLLAR